MTGMPRRDIPCWGMLFGKGLPTVYLRATKRRYTFGRAHDCDEKHACYIDDEIDVSIPCVITADDPKPAAMRISRHQFSIEWNGRGIPGYGEGSDSYDEHAMVFTVRNLGRSSFAMAEVILHETHSEFLAYGDWLQLVPQDIRRAKKLQPFDLCYGFTRADNPATEALTA